MIQRFSDILRVSATALAQEGAFNGVVNIDSQFHIDPHLLTASSASELSGSYQRFTEYFENVIRLLAVSNSRGDRMFRRAAKRLLFPEIPYMWLGYGKGNKSIGKGIGRKLALQLTHTAFDIVQAGIKDPVIFELVGLLEEGIGADRISDMTARIIMPNLAAFSERVAKKLKLPVRMKKVNGEWFHLPYKRARFILLVPMDILRPLPIAHDWDSIERVITYNQQLRDSLNRVLGKTWQDIKKLRKGELKALILDDPQIILEIIDDYKNQPPAQYDFLNDPDGILIWHELAKLWGNKHPLKLQKPERISIRDLEKIILAICTHFKQLVERNGLNTLLYNDRGTLRHGIFAKLIFFGLADVYCGNNDLDLTRDANANGQPIDFKISQGYKTQVQVYVKYTSNRHLVSTYEKVLEALQQEALKGSAVFVVIRTTKQNNQSTKLQQLYNQAINQEKLAPKLIFVDGRYIQNNYDAIVRARVNEVLKQEAKTSDSSKNGSTQNDLWNKFREKPRERAQTVKRLKESNPEWSQLQVAMKAQEELGYAVTKDDVINDYRKMRELGIINWEWQHLGKD